MSAALTETETVTLEGRRDHAPAGRLLTVILIVSGVRPALRIGEWAARALLGFRRPVTLEFSAGGLALHERTELSGRVLSEVRRFIPTENLEQVCREVRYSRAPVYAGALALAAGSSVGTGLLSDAIGGAKASPSLAAWGVLLLSIGLGLDFFLTTRAEAARKRCRLVVTPRSGRAFGCADIDCNQADSGLRRLETRS